MNPKCANCGTTLETVCGSLLCWHCGPLPTKSPAIQRFTLRSEIEEHVGWTIELLQFMQHERNSSKRLDAIEELSSILCYIRYDEEGGEL